MSDSFGIANGPQLDVAALLDPELAEVAQLEVLQHLSGPMLPALRQAMRGAQPPLSNPVVRSDHILDGVRPAAIRVHRPRDVSGPLACVVSMHGGGFVLGHYGMDDTLFDRWCPDLGIVGVSVDYGLAPECPYPGPLEDCFAALEWTVEHADELGVDRARIGLHGLSAGGGLAAAVALLARERGGPPLAFQILDCPMLDDRQVTFSSRLPGLHVWSRETNRFAWQAYLGSLYGADDLPATAAPARAADLTTLPPAFLSVGAIDGFHDEVVDYAVRLNHAGVPTELHVYPGTPHGYQVVATSSVTRRAFTDKTEWLRRTTAVAG